MYEVIHRLLTVYPQGYHRRGKGERTVRGRVHNGTFCYISVHSRLSHGYRIAIVQNLTSLVHIWCIDSQYLTKKTGDN
jgi:hypothetical protein